MDDAAKRFLQRLEAGPAILLLGQGHLAVDTGVDPLLAQVREKYGALAPAGYHGLLELKHEGTDDELLAWMDERSRRLPTPAALTKIADFAWSSVVTSAVDSVLPAVFRRPWREVQSVFDEQHDPADPRNRSRLHITFLYGNVNRTEPEQRVPLGRLAFLKRSQVATALARRLPALVTPLGTVAIEAYASDDWLGLEQLVPILADLTSGQVHIFSAEPSIRDNSLLRELATTGVVEFHDDSLATVLASGNAAGLIRLGPLDAGRGTHPIKLEERTAHVPVDLWTRVRTGATVLDDPSLVQPRALSLDARYREFRAFLGAGDGVPDWAGFARGFAFPRHFQAELRAVVNRSLSNPGFQDHPIVVHGPTGSGKTTALAALARDIRLEGRYPVLFIERGAQPPNFGDLDLFCEWAEGETAPATLIVWDGMVGGGEYRDLLRYLSSRGRNVIVVGSSYRLSREQAKGKLYVEAPAELSSEERQEFLSFLRGFDDGLDELIRRQGVMADESFLVALYRLLPPVRGVVRTGVAREVRHAEHTMATTVAEGGAGYKGATALARALYEAGLITVLTTETAQKVGTEKVDDFQHLTGLVMVPGRFGLRVPLELLLRTLGQESFANFLELLKGVDIFRWYEDANGNIEIGPRTRLEAALIAEARTGDAETEIALVRELILNAKQDLSTFAGGREVAFTVGLLQAVGPGGQETDRFAGYLTDLADTLREARLERGLANARLMLQEANLRRESAIAESKGHTPDFDFIDKSLDEAESVVRAGLELLSDHQRSRGLRSALLVELASTMGARSTQLLRREDNRRGEAAGLVVALRDVVARARLEDPTTYHPVDVLAWATRNAIEKGLLVGSDKLEAVSDVLSAFQSMEVQELEPQQVEQYHSRRYQIGELIGDAELAGDAFEELKKRGSGAALFLLALRTSGLVVAGERGQHLKRERIQRAVDLLEAEESLLWGDRRCLDLYLDLWWLTKSETPLFSGERQTPGLSRSEWQHFLKIVLALEEQQGSRREAVLAFLRGLALFHVGRVGESLATFKLVERQSTVVRSRRRVIRTFLASHENGTPREFHGTVHWIDPRGRRGDLYVEELRAAITFLAHDFRLDDVRQGLDLGAFHIAFNFLGPIADPPVFTGTR